MQSPIRIKRFLDLEKLNDMASRDLLLYTSQLVDDVREFSDPSSGFSERRVRHYLDVRRLNQNRDLCTAFSDAKVVTPALKLGINIYGDSNEKRIQ